MRYKGRVFGLFLVITNSLIWIFHEHLDLDQKGAVAFKIFFPLLCLPFFWWLGKIYDNYKIQTNELKTSNEWFQTIFEKAGIGITVIDHNGRPIMVNPKLQEMLGYTENELKKMTLSDFSYPDDAKINYDLLNQLTDRKIESYQLEKRYYRKDGTTVWGQVTSSLFPYNDGELSYVIGLIIDITERKNAEEKLLKVNQQLELLSNIDGLTGIANRRYFDQHLVQEWEKAKTHLEPISLIMFDFDFFKAFNDTYGHLVGDICLKNTSEILNRYTAFPDRLVARYGGEEFAVILSGQEAKNACSLAEELRIAVESMQLPHEHSLVSQFVTISIGVATLIPHSDSSQEDLIDAADKALYQAKLEGRNRVCSFVINLPEKIKND
ncbi:sensor domain-containing diguanylate cyclase [Neobacillus sp. LXY-4]|uniref:sensor domain-containing diguanylate cyclase n=1 Tax=Neobacillus sp. LXY-4 TaxID=3379826 RepID=UPI003EE13DD8